MGASMTLLDRAVLDRAIRLERGALDITKENLCSKTTDPRHHVIGEAVQRLCDAGMMEWMQTTGNTGSIRYRVTDKGREPIFRSRRKTA